MKAEKISQDKTGHKKKILIEIENQREKLIMLCMLHDTYALQEFIKTHSINFLSGTEPEFTHEEIKEVADKIYIAI